MSECLKDVFTSVLPCCLSLLNFFPGLLFSVMLTLSQSNLPQAHSIEELSGHLESRYVQ